ncbi:MAG TPA: hypothetical protein ENJ56_06810 [Anaerolineae bacterium]|nr:hypothetical protein [Anaerolineae bacterium]
MLRSLTLTFLGAFALLLVVIAVVLPAQGRSRTGQRLTQTPSPIPTCTPVPTPIPDTTAVPTATPNPASPCEEPPILTPSTTPTPTLTPSKTPSSILPDLVVNYAFVEHDFPCLGVPHITYLHVYVGNQGNVDAGQFYVYANGDAQLLTGLPAQQQVQIQFNGHKNPSIIAVDSADFIDESNERNNELVLMVPDLTATPPPPCTPTPELDHNYLPVIMKDGETINPTPIISPTPTPSSTATATPYNPYPIGTPTP